MSNVILFPVKGVTPESWVAANPEVFFVREGPRVRRCSLCKRNIRPGEQYFGQYEMKPKFNADDELVAIRVTSRVGMRLHPKCAKELK